MAMPLLVKVSSGVPSGDVETVRHLIELVSVLMAAPLGECEIHVKYSKRLFHRTTGYAYYNYDGRPFSAQVGGLVRVHPDARYLLTIKLYEGYRARYTAGLGYPRPGPQVMHYARYKTFPYTTLYTWEEELVYILAHEMWHVVQYERPRRAGGRASASELECEHAAIGGLALYRAVLGMGADRADAAEGVGKAASR